MNILLWSFDTVVSNQTHSLIQSTRVRRLILDEHLRVVFRDGSHLQPAMKPLKCRVSFSPVPPIPPTPHKREQAEACCPWERSLSICWVSSMCNTPCCKMHWTVGAAVVAVGLTGQVVGFECLEGLARTHRACELAPVCVHRQIKPSASRVLLTASKGLFSSSVDSTTAEMKRCVTDKVIFPSPDWESLP